MCQTPSKRRTDGRTDSPSLGWSLTLYTRKSFTNCRASRTINDDKHTALATRKNNTSNNALGKWRGFDICTPSAKGGAAHARVFIKTTIKVIKHHPDVHQHSRENVRTDNYHIEPLQSIYCTKKLV